MPSESLHDDSRGPAIQRALPAILAALAALIVYSVTLGGTYIYDDVILHEDPRFTHVSQWTEFWTKDYMPGAVDKLYRPLTCLSFAIEYSIHGDRPWAYHLINWLLHAGAAAAVAELARRLVGFRPAIAAGVLFAVHPVHVEAVAGLVGRAELLCTLASVVAMILFLRAMTFARSAGICACFAIAIFSKEQGILLPALLLALSPFRKRLLAGTSGETSALQSSNIHSTSDKVAQDRGVMPGLFAAMCLMLAAYLVFREELLGFAWDRQKLDWTANPLVRSTGWDRLLMPIVLVGRYLALAVAPRHLSLDYGANVIGSTVRWNEPFIYLGILAIAVYTFAALLMIRRRSWNFLFLLLGLGLSYGMVGNFPILIGTIMGERLMYLPSVFFLILVAALLSRIPRRAFCIIMIVLTTLATIRTFTYAKRWNHPLRLYSADLAEHPGSMILHSLMVDQYLARDDFKAARAMGERSLRELPDAWDSYRMVVAADARMEDFADAERVLVHADSRVDRERIRKLRNDLEAYRENQVKTK